MIHYSINRFWLDAAAFARYLLMGLSITSLPMMLCRAYG